MGNLTNPAVSESRPAVSANAVATAMLSGTAPTSPAARLFPTYATGVTYLEGDPVLDTSSPPECYLCVQSGTTTSSGPAPGSMGQATTTSTDYPGVTLFRTADNALWGHVPNFNGIAISNTDPSKTLTIGEDPGVTVSSSGRIDVPHGESVQIGWGKHPSALYVVGGATFSLVGQV